MMNSIRRGWEWHVLVACAVGGAVATLENCVSAQNITLDGTLGSAGTLTGPDYVIRQQLGQTVDSNLFHSFGKFNLDTGETATFYSSPTIKNILARVTGGQSLINGFVQTNSGSVNLFLLNPRGIVFGPDARLNVGDSTRGSFVATTVDALVWSNGKQFSATNPGDPASLLTIVGDPSGFLASLRSPQPIISSSTNLTVHEGQSLLFLGGNVSLDNSILRARSGRIELGGVAGAGTVELNVESNKLRLIFPKDLALADISLGNGSRASVTSERAGEIQVYGRHVKLTGGSQIVSNTGLESGGSVTVTAADSVELSGESADGQVSSGLFAGAFSSGNGGALSVNTQQLIVRGGAQISTANFGEGQGGNLTVNAADSVVLSGLTADGSSPSGLIATSVGSGTGGNLKIDTGKLVIQDGAQVQAATSGTGRAGTLDVTANSIELSGTFSSLVTTSLGSGSAGDIKINTGRLIVRDGAEVIASTEGKGRAGNLEVTTSDFVELSGTTADGRKPSVLSTETRDAGNAGDLKIYTPTLIIRDGAQVLTSTAPGSTGQGGNLTVSASNSVRISGLSADGKYASGLFAGTQGTGAAGAIRINTGDLIVQSGAQVTTSTDSEGQGGSLSVNASSVQLLGTTIDGQSASGLFTNTTGTGAAGNLRIDTRRLVVRDGAGVIAGTDLGSEGTGGNLTVNASDYVELSGTTPNGQNPSGLVTLTQGTGDAGNLTINTRQLFLSSGAQVSAATLNRGRGGNLAINASDLVQVNGTSINGETASGLFSNTKGTGAAGDLTIAAKQLVIQNGAIVAVGSDETGKAGNLGVTAHAILLENQGRLVAETASGNGGNIKLQAQDLLLLRHGGSISTTAGTNRAGGDGGNITVNAGFVVAVPKENSDIRANAYTGRGGNIQVNAQGIFGIQFRPQDTPLSDITASSQFGIQGVVTVNTPGIDPSRGLANLPTAPVDASRQIAQGCYPGSAVASQQNKFVITGRGGLPPNPREALNGDAVNVDWVTLGAQSERSDANTSVNPDRTSSVATPAPAVAEAQGWVYGPNGEVILTATLPPVTPECPLNRSPSAH